MPQNSPQLNSSFNMEKIIQENNKKLNRFCTDYDQKFEELKVEEMDEPPEHL